MPPNCMHREEQGRGDRKNGRERGMEGGVVGVRDNMRGEGRRTEYEIG